MAFLMREPSANFLGQLLVQQIRVSEAISRLAAVVGWRVALDTPGRNRLRRLGHFTYSSVELDMTPLEVVGHLTDSALAFTDRIGRLRDEVHPAHLSIPITRAQLEL